MVYNIQNEHWVFFSFDDYSHLVPMLELAHVLINMHHFHITVVIEESNIQKFSNVLAKVGLIDIQENRPGLSYYAIKDHASGPGLFGADEVICNLVEEATTALTDIHELNPFSSVVLEMFTCAVLPFLKPFNVSHYLYSTTNSLALVQRSIANITPDSFLDLPACPEEITVQVAKEAITNLPLLLSICNNFKGSKKMPFADTAKYFTMEKLTFNAIEAMKSAKAVLMNSYDGFDTESLDVMSSHPSMSQTKFLYIGPVAFYNQTTEIPVKKSSIENWLDVQPKSSVLYIAFGTVFNIKDEEVVNLAKALATLNCRYVWALKKHQIEHLPSDILVIDGDDPIPVDQKGFVVTWALQRQILNHSATHSFLSHCGWNSCTEALSSATPIIAWPIAAEQKLNSIVILAKSIGTLIQKTGKASEHVVTENEIIEAITAHSENLDEFSLNMKRYQTLLLESIAEDGNSYNTMKSLYIAE